jgi:hypothetical protein
MPKNTAVALPDGVAFGVAGYAVLLNIQVIG